MNPNEEIARNSLFRAVEHSYRSLAPFRNFAAGLVEEYAGSGYGSPKSRREILLNLIRQNVVASVMGLAANRPRVMATAENVLLHPFSLKFAKAVNNLCKSIKLENVLRTWVLHAFFAGDGFVKVHRADAGIIEIEPDIWMDPGKPFASNISLDNWVHDHGATAWSQIKFCGDWYRLPLEEVKSSSAFDEKATRELVATTKYATDMRQEDLTRGQTVDYDELEPMVDLCDLYVPGDQSIYTFALDQGTNFRPKGRVLAVLPAGPDRNPYKKLGFHEVPENIISASQGGDIASLARVVNNLARKQVRQAHRQKDVHTYTAAGADSAKKIQRASDGEWVEVNDPKEIGLVKQGGVDQKNMMFLEWAIGTADRMAGNITAKLGLGAQAPTKGQEELIHQAVDGIEANMHQRTYEATVDLVRDLGLLLWEDKFMVIPGRLDVPGADGVSYDATWTPDERFGEFLDYELTIDVHSVPYRSPQQQAAIFDHVIRKYSSLGPLLQAQGHTINIQEAIDIDAEFYNQPRIRRLIQSILPVEPSPAEDQQGMPAQTTRSYVRKNVRAGGTPEEQRSERMQQWSQMSEQSDAAQAA